MTSGEIVSPGFVSRDHVACAICPYLRAVLIVAAAYALNAAAAASSEVTPAREPAPARSFAGLPECRARSELPAVPSSRSGLGEAVPISSLISRLCPGPQIRADYVS